MPTQNQLNSPVERLANNLSAAGQKLLHDTAALVSDTVLPMAPVWERERRMGSEGLQAAVDIGLTRIQVPESYGGLNLPFRCKAAVAELLAQADFGFSMSVLNTQNVAAKLANDAPAAIAEQYVPDIISGQRIGCTALTEPGAGSDFSAIEMLATKHDDHWELNGEKAWITNAAQADVVVMFVQTEKDSGARGIGGFVIDGSRNGFERQPAYGMAGQHSIGAGGFRLAGYQAQQSELFLAPGQAFKLALGSINGARIYVAAMCCGMLAGALQDAAQYGLQRQTFGHNLHGHQGWRWMLSEAATDLLAAQHLVDAVAARFDAGHDVQFEAAKTKVFATRMAERHLGNLLQAMGAQGLREDNPVGRHQVGVRMAGFVDGATEILLDRIASQMSRMM